MLQDLEEMDANLHLRLQEMILKVQRIEFPAFSKPNSLVFSSLLSANFISISRSYILYPYRPILSLLLSSVHLITITSISPPEPLAIQLPRQTSSRYEILGAGPLGIGGLWLLE
ncbi:hypothetical protein OCU04_000146 [Sclerotinia nivalis]|uniref:Uncharacterized protein n=1 Tax=Sclerotinia nivalis TaxID=352851 RepID=A0A9X0DQ10_9HELO|nr:hypothetical protein OCU04_000146 [Sclerotinia nivalis]